MGDQGRHLSLQCLIFKGTKAMETCVGVLAVWFGPYRITKFREFRLLLESLSVFFPLNV